MNYSIFIAQSNVNLSIEPLSTERKYLAQVLRFTLIYLLRITITIELVLQAKLRQNVIEWVVFVFHYIVVIEIGNFTSFNEHFKQIYNVNGLTSTFTPNVFTSWRFSANWELCTIPKKVAIPALSFNEKESEGKETKVWRMCALVVSVRKTKTYGLIQRCQLCLS